MNTYILYKLNCNNKLIHGEFKQVSIKDAIKYATYLYSKLGLIGRYYLQNTTTKEIIQINNN